MDENWTEQMMNIKEDLFPLKSLAAPEAVSTEMGSAVLCVVPSARMRHLFTTQPREYSLVQSRFQLSVL